MKELYLDIPSNTLIDTAGTGTYGFVSIPDLVANNTSFWLVGEQLWTKTDDFPYTVTGTVNGEPYEKTFTE